MQITTKIKSAAQGHTCPTTPKNLVKLCWQLSELSCSKTNIQKQRHNLLGTDDNDISVIPSLGFKIFMYSKLLRSFIMLNSIQLDHIVIIIIIIEQIRLRWYKQKVKVKVMGHMLLVIWNCGLRDRNGIWAEIIACHYLREILGGLNLPMMMLDIYDG